MASKWGKMHFFKASYKQMWQNSLLMLNFVVFKKFFESFSYGLISWITCLGTRGTPPNTSHVIGIHLQAFWRNRIFTSQKRFFGKQISTFLKQMKQFSKLSASVDAKNWFFQKVRSISKICPEKMLNMDLNSLQLLQRSNLI